ncbi:Flp family type IVb pilin [Actinacidiphila yeochonensis]|uniref:Flp family type IVb pilin n=1 Tax=Actinacidiphila yeochonensis TaxID=89050 RepID=UPI00055DE86D|nr:hypothetical protein [Actinacidiphila yeochonensis]
MNRLKSFEANDPTLQFVVAYLRGRVERARSQELSRGASAVEWVVISAIVVTIVAAVGFIITNALKDKAGSVKSCIDSANGSSNC